MYKVVVAGSINMDVVARSRRCPNPGETIMGTDLNFFPGGKGANQAVAASRIGAHTELIGCVGDDAFGSSLVNFLSDQNVDVKQVMKSSATATGTALIVVADSGENAIVVVPGSNFELKPNDLDSVKFQKGDVLVSQLEIMEPTIRRFFELGREQGATTILNPAPAQESARTLFELTDILVLNESELAEFTGRTKLENPDQSTLVEMIESVKAFDEQVVVVTLGAKGLVASVGRRRITVNGRKVKAVDTTGAGDCFVGTLAGRLSAGDTLDQSLVYANCAASLSVQKPGAGVSMPSNQEVAEALKSEALSVA